MARRLYLDPEASDAAVIEWGGKCYHRVGDSTQPPMVDAVDEYEDCDTCEEAQQRYQLTPCPAESGASIITSGAEADLDGIAESSLSDFVDETGSSNGKTIEIDLTPDKWYTVKKVDIGAPVEVTALNSEDECPCPDFENVTIDIIGIVSGVCCVLVSPNRWRSYIELDVNGSFTADHRVATPAYPLSNDYPEEVCAYYECVSVVSPGNIGELAQFGDDTCSGTPISSSPHRSYRCDFAFGKATGIVYEVWIRTFDIASAELCSSNSNDFQIFYAKNSFSGLGYLGEPIANQQVCGGAWIDRIGFTRYAYSTGGSVIINAQ